MGVLQAEGHLAVSNQRRDSAGRFAEGEHDEAGSDLVSETHRKSLAQFVHALRALDEELRGLDLPEPIKVRAIGGFALLSHDIREDGYTVDIDTLTEEYDERVRDAINRVAADLWLERDWINNQAAADSAEEAIATMDAVFIAADYGFDNIDLSVADIPTLTRAKAIAVDTDMLSGRTRDWDDLVSLVERQGIETHEEFCRRYPGVPEWEYPETHRSLAHWFDTGERGESEPEDDFDLDDLEWED